MALGQGETPAGQGLPCGPEGDPMLQQIYAEGLHSMENIHTEAEKV